MNRNDAVDGIHSVIVDKFNDLHTPSLYFADDMGFVFRGHADAEWKIETTLDRLIPRIKATDFSELDTYRFHRTNFLSAIRGRTLMTKDEAADDDSVWALGQHYELATPLLDWTSSLYVALYFAFIDDCSPPNGYRRVWALHHASVRKSMSTYNEGKDREVQTRFVDPMTNHIPRMLSQVGCFIHKPLYFGLENWLMNTFSGSTRSHIFRIDIADKLRPQILSHLRLMNIHGGSLFPDINGAAAFCNETLEHFAQKWRRKTAIAPPFQI
ncbi:FRG domain-containing protein [Xanthomonas graminis]|uniref:FRG domain-containing protein n=1 Tax=Xanthomonas graminis pv. arrhenatheri LMG 727 TaxID=1195923 RepID=A0A0K2ZWY6_9XANT|nr:FRG domain-containing protein [Xanthomonas translucens]UKE77308.1 FRG domain-containing protein [Xanthomonas translucens pv. arrhenatheri]CTP90316.1 hypothetical protein XTALMG727_3023 [Xanthomonas translucens pv. arrhenatheri LMG 727]